jgi:hypothetical protein
VEGQSRREMALESRSTLPTSADMDAVSASGHPCESLPCGVQRISWSTGTLPQPVVACESAGVGEKEVVASGKAGRL